MARVEDFIKTQQPVFDAAVQLTQDLSHELDYLSKEEASNQALNQVRLITMISANGPYNYTRTRELNAPRVTVHEGHDRLLQDKRDELPELSGSVWEPFTPPPWTIAI